MELFAYSLRYTAQSQGSSLWVDRAKTLRAKTCAQTVGQYLLSAIDTASSQVWHGLPARIEAEACACLSLISTGADGCCAAGRCVNKFDHWCPNLGVHAAPQPCHPSMPTWHRTVRHYCMLSSCML